MKIILKIILILFIPFVANAQQKKPAILQTILQNATTDSAKHNAYADLYWYYYEVNRDSALIYAEKRLSIARQNKIKLAEAAALISKGYQFDNIGRYAESFQNLMQALKIAEDVKNKEVPGWRVTQYPVAEKNRLIILATIHHVLGALMFNTENQEQEIIQLKKGLQLAAQINHPDRMMTGNMNLATAYLRMQLPDSALYFAKAAEKISGNLLAQQYTGNNLLTLGNTFMAKGDTIQAMKYYYKGLLSATTQNIQNNIAKINHRLVVVYLHQNKKDSVLKYAVNNLKVVESIGGISDQQTNMGTAYEDLYLAYELNKQPDSAYKYQGLALTTKDSLYKIRIKNLADFQKLSLNEAMRLENLEKEKIQTQSKIRTYGLLLGLAVLSIIGFILYRNNRQKQKANLVLQEQKQKVETTLQELKSTQSQLIQSEKMASLGELTAGIAHEIQNPLNFVNNFSEVNTELIGELVEEVNKGNTDEVKAIANDIKENSEKINHHGQRAAAIVKGMLQHSSSSSGVKELTAINALCDEYLRLSYYGLQAKDKSFNATVKTDFENSIGNINIIPQDIGRVVLNLLTNAFYAVDEKKKTGVAGYEPTVSIATRYIQPPLGGRAVEIKVSDNGGGIQQNIVDKIFQPFFTTKPAGQGTGLGLSLSYDIVKAHGGEFKVDTKEGDGTVFIVILPIS